ncbi:MAG: metal-dependent hydrolase [Vicinamibacteria bacterium]
MPTPLGHALAGLAVAGIAGSRKPLPPAHIAILVACATAPDLDLLLKFVDGANHHRGFTHSLFAAFLAGAVATALSFSGRSVPGAFAVGAAWASHVLLDFLGVDTSPPAGEMALWPFSSGFYVSPVSLFYDVPRSFTASAIRHNIAAVVIEIVVMVPVALVCWRRRPVTANSSGLLH